MMGTMPPGSFMPPGPSPGGMHMMDPRRAEQEEIKAHIDLYGRQSYAMTPEEAHMGFEPNVVYPQPGAPNNFLDPEPGLVRTIVKLPHPRYQGSPEFVDGLPKRNSTFAWSELAATRAPESSLAPVPQVPLKSWWNTYVYVPEQRSHVERQYLERYVPGPDGEWLDVVKARRMLRFFDDHQRKAEAWQEEQNAVKSGAVVDLTDYTNAYSGEHLVAVHGELMPKGEVYEKYDIHKSEWGKYVDDARLMDFDNLRTPWPFGRIDRNKKVSQHAYDYFDRRNTFIPSDRSFKMMELPSYYVDEDLYFKWRATGEDGPVGYAHDAMLRAAHPVDDYPYKL